MYIAVLNKHLLTSVKDLKMKYNLMSKQDKNPKQHLHNQTVGF